MEKKIHFLLQELHCRQHRSKAPVFFGFFGRVESAFSTTRRETISWISSRERSFFFGIFYSIVLEKLGSHQKSRCALGALARLVGAHLDNLPGCCKTPTSFLARPFSRCKNGWPDFCVAAKRRK